MSIMQRGFSNALFLFAAAVFPTAAMLPSTAAADQGIGIIETVAGSGVNYFDGDGGPATAAGIGSPQGVAVGLDGSIYITGPGFRVRRVGPDGIITTVAGIGVGGSSGDGGPATEAQLGFDLDVALGPDSRLYIAQNNFYIPGSNSRIRRVTSDGIISTVPGGVNTCGGYSGVAVGPDGSVYTAGSNGWVICIRRIAPDGSMTMDHTQLIWSESDYRGDTNGIALGPDGSVYFAAPQEGRVYRIGPAGGWPTLATQAYFFHVKGLAVGPDGNLYITNSNQVQRVNPDGSITAVAGLATWGYTGDGGPATQARLHDPEGIAFGPDGYLYIADKGNRRIRRVKLFESNSCPGG